MCLSSANQPNLWLKKYIHLCHLQADGLKGHISVIYASVCEPVWISDFLRTIKCTEFVMTQCLQLFVGPPLCWGYFWQRMCQPEKSWKWRAAEGREREGRLSPLYLTYIACQMLLVLGMCQGHGVGRQDVAGGLHFIPGLLVQVL